ncbi:Fimbrial protein [Burkholderia ambifaria IOP40-10]|uniref:Fimbrial protein n=1 Tax=Burkholderia ambifaria IOP40-10 TaxID=396596 RepID=B1F959_9BURK|nr:fimbrial protein [Burkholderia ambifaria]EDT05831.1 Fimbrial protein [Burkholderia ambifaria IOP40-10]
MKAFISRSIRIFAVVGVGAMFSQFSWAAGPDQAVNINVPNPLKVMQSGPVGELLGNKWSSSPWMRGALDGNNKYLAFRSVTEQKKDSGVSVPGPGGLTYEVYELNADGIGIAEGVEYRINGGEEKYMAFTGAILPYILEGYGDKVEARFYFSFVRIGEIGKDSKYMFPLLAYVSETVNSGSSGSGWGWKVNASPMFGSIVVEHPTCQIQTDNVRVDMGNGVTTQIFKKTGDKSAPVTFGVSMTCPARINKIFYKLRPAGGSTVVGNPNDGNISLSNQGGQGDASGVGVHIENGDPSTPIPLGQNLQINQYNPNKDNQHIQTNFTASYIRIDGNLKGGEADAKATYTLSYE